jgi:hypothetical protein
VIRLAVISFVLPLIACGSLVKVDSDGGDSIDASTIDAPPQDPCTGDIDIADLDQCIGEAFCEGFDRCTYFVADKSDCEENYSTYFPFVGNFVDGLRVRVAAGVQGINQTAIHACLDSFRTGECKNPGANARGASLQDQRRVRRWWSLRRRLRRQPMLRRRLSLPSWGRCRLLTGGAMRPGS